MMRRSQREFNPSAIEQAAQRNWNEGWGYHRDNSRRYFLLSAGCLIIAGLAVGRSWYFDTQPKLVPYVIDRNGPSLLSARLTVSMPDAARIEGHLRTWVAGMRTVTSDPFMQQKLAQQTFAWTDSTSIGQQQLSAWYALNDPRVRVLTNTVDVDVTSVVLQAGETWLVDWTETAYAREPGKAVLTTRWRMTVTVHVRLPETEEHIIANWDGVFATSFHVIPL